MTYEYWPRQSEGSKFFQKLCVASFWLGLGFLVNLWAAVVLSTLWGWFIANKFSLPELSCWEAFGILLISRFLGATYIKGWWEHDKKDIYLWLLFRSTIILFFGWIIKLFIDASC